MVYIIRVLSGLVQFITSTAFTITDYLYWHIMSTLIILSMVLFALVTTVSVGILIVMRKHRIWIILSSFAILFSITVSVILYLEYFNENDHDNIIDILIVLAIAIFVVLFFGTVSIIRYFRTQQQIEDERRVREMYMHSPIGYQSLDTDGKFLDVNPAWTDTMGYSRQEIAGKYFGDLLTNNDKGKFEERFANFKKNGYVRSVLWEMKTKNGEIRKIEFDGNAVYDRTGRFIKTHCILRDVTEQHYNRQKREFLTRSLEEKNKEMQQLMGAMSHDLKTPVVSLKGFSSELEKKVSTLTNQIRHLDITPEKKLEIENILSQDIRDCLAFITSSTDKIEKLTESLGYLAKIGNMKFDNDQINMTELIRKVIDQHQFYIRSTHAKIIVKDIPPCTGDAEALNRIFSNILSNALKYRNPTKPCIIEISGKEDAGCLKYSVRDNGIGIEKSKQDEIFKPFVRLGHIQAPGDGLGLNIVKAIVSKIGGSVWVESETGSGTEFVICLKTDNASI